MNHREIVMRSDLHRRMQFGGSRTTHHQRHGQTRLLHLLRHVRHLLQRGCDQARETDQIGLLLNRLLDNHLGGNHHAQVDHLIVIAG